MSPASEPAPEESDLASNGHEVGAGPVGAGPVGAGPVRAEAGGAETEAAVGGAEIGEAYGAGADEAGGAEPADGEPGDAEVVEPEVEKSELEIAIEQRDRNLADLQRVSAEFANFRKQTEKRRAETVRLAAAGLVQEILPVLDAFDAAELAEVAGVQPIAEQLRRVLEREGLEIISEAEEFDPTRHEAAISEPAEEGQTQATVAEVLRKGYVFNGRVLRAAMVRVRGG